VFVERLEHKDDRYVFVFLSSACISLSKKRTSGARMSIIDTKKSDHPNDDFTFANTNYCHEELYSDSIAWNLDRPYDDASSWLHAVDTLLQRCLEHHPDLLRRVRSICVSGTSASCLIVDSSNKVTRSPRMYDFNVITTPKQKSSIAKDPNDSISFGLSAVDLLNSYCPPKHTSRAPTSSLAKLLSWHREQPLIYGERLLHQADYVAMNFLDLSSSYCENKRFGNLMTTTSDWHNCLKLGFDVQKLKWPDWLLSCLSDAGIPFDPNIVLPSRVVSPGEVIGQVNTLVASKYGIPAEATVVGGTTDSNAAFFAAVGGSKPTFGTAVTSLGSTLAIKFLSRNFVEDADRGVYSHRFPLLHAPTARNNSPNMLDADAGKDGDRRSNSSAWLVGGASNVGCAILTHLGFSNSELRELSETIDPSKNSTLNYYPLKTRGERFPIADNNLEPILEPIPESRSEYLHALLQGITNVEGLGFQVLGDLGSSPKYPHLIWSCGGGAENHVWIQMRQRILTECFGQPVQVLKSNNTEASYGAAILAATSYEK
jgi:sugar (pentulose or hexulose) kinase